MTRLIVLLPLIISISCLQKERSVIYPTRPNILIILVDDLGKEWVSTYGADDIETPNIDQLAGSGVKFNHVYGMPQCTPSRVTLLTGQYPFRHGWVNHWDVPRWGGGAHFDESLNPVLPVEVKKAGYKTCIAGKWQIDDFRLEPDAMTRCGFDEFCMWTGGEAENTPSFNRYHSPYIFTREGSRVYEGQYGPDVFADFVKKFILANKDSSMFIYYPMVLTHTPFHNPPLDSAPSDKSQFKAMVKYADQILGELIYTLEEAGIRDKTLVLWTTDNGTSHEITGSRKGRKVKGGKSTTSEAGICLPFIASWPSVIAPNGVSDELIDFTDIFPTCLDLADIEVQKQYAVGNKTHVLDGVSFKRVLINKEASQRKWILGMGGGNKARLTEKRVENNCVFRDRVIRNKQFKLYIDSKRMAVGFYDLEVDPEENINLIDSLHISLRKENFEELHRIIDGLPLKDADPVYIPNPAQKWDVAVSAQSQIWKE